MASPLAKRLFQIDGVSQVCALGSRVGAGQGRGAGQGVPGGAGVVCCSARGNTCSARPARGLPTFPRFACRPGKCAAPAPPQGCLRLPPLCPPLNPCLPSTHSPVPPTASLPPPPLQIFFGSDFVTVTKSEDYGWAVLKVRLVLQDAVSLCIGGAGPVSVLCLQPCTLMHSRQLPASPPAPPSPRVHLSTPLQSTPSTPPPAARRVCGNHRVLRVGGAAVLRRVGAWSSRTHHHRGRRRGELWERGHKKRGIQREPEGAKGGGKGRRRRWRRRVPQARLPQSCPSSVLTRTSSQVMMTAWIVRQGMHEGDKRRRGERRSGEPMKRKKEGAECLRWTKALQIQPALAVFRHMHSAPLLPINPAADCCDDQGAAGDANPPRSAGARSRRHRRTLGAGSHCLWAAPG